MTFLRHLALRGGTRSIARRTQTVAASKSYATESPQVISPLDTLTEEEFLARHPEVLNRRRNDLIQAYHNKNTILHTTSKLGSQVTDQYRPNDVYVNPPSPADVSIELLLASQTHFGHATSLWHPANSRYIFGIREGIHIISLDITAAHLRRAARVVSGVAERGGIILFIGTRRGHQRMVVRAASLAGGCHIFERWIPGTITNAQQILGKCSAKVVDEFDREVPGFDRQVSELAPLKPDLVVCLNVLENPTVLQECGQAGIPTIGIIDTDVNPTWVTYPIPANDDSIRSVSLIAGVLGRAGQEGQQNRRKAAQEGRATYLPPQGIAKPGVTDEAVIAEEYQPPTNAGPSRMGQGSNYYEAGLTPRGEPLGASSEKTMGSDHIPPEKTMSAEKRATPGVRPTVLTDRSPTANVDTEAAAHPMTPNPGTAGRPTPGRKLKEEDASLEQGGSQV